MNKFFSSIGEAFSEGSGATCIIQISVGLSFIVVWGVWAYLVVKNKQIVDLPAGVVTLLSATLASKVVKDINDSKYYDRQNKLDQTKIVEDATTIINK